MSAVAQRRFSLDDQKRFAAASGDYNPMHMDPLQARRTQAGAPVVHGIHMLLWGLDALAESQRELPPLRRIRAHFNKFVYLDENVEVVVSEQNPTRARLNLAVDGSPRAKLTIDFGDAGSDEPGFYGESLRPMPLFPEAQDLGYEQMEGLSGRLSFAMKPEVAAAMFPAATLWLGAERVAALAATTYLVGMVCPGLHSIYSELTISTCVLPDGEPSLAFRVVESDARFRAVQIEVAGGGLTGILETTARTPPVRQAEMSALTGLVGPAEFAGTTALVVGGSRGLGELTAKLIAAGGGKVIVTWKSGKDDAERVALEIRAVGGECETLPYDASKPAATQLEGLAEAPTHAYYFATPGIFRPQAEIFARERLHEFMTVYVDGFWQLARALRALRPEISLYYPSSVSVTERPAGMTEYTMAKVAGETLASDMNQSLAPLHVTVTRLPRLPTDQTATVAAVETASPVGVMLPIVREVQSWPR